MAAITDLLNTNWGPYSHTEVEEAIKEKFREIDRALENASSEGGIGYDELSKAVRDLLDLASTALQPGSIANWAKQPNRPDYTVDDIIYDGLTKLSQKLAAMDAAIQQAAASGAVEPDSAMSDSSENAVQNKIVKAYIDAVSLRLDTLIGSNNVQGVIDTFNEVKAFLNGINTSDPTLYNTLQTLNTNINNLQNTLSQKANSSDLANYATTGQLAQKQDKLTFDDAPGNTDNPVKSRGIKQAIDEKLSQVTVNAIPAGSIAVEDVLVSSSKVNALSANMGAELYTLIQILFQQLNMVEVSEDGLYFIDSNNNIGVCIDSDGLHAINILEHVITG